VTERLIRIHPTNHTLIRGVKGDSLKDSGNLAVGLSLLTLRPSQLCRGARLAPARDSVATGTSPSRRFAPKGRMVTAKPHHDMI
jgi:hypothetical protein